MSEFSFERLGGAVFSFAERTSLLGGPVEWSLWTPQAGHDLAERLREDLGRLEPDRGGACDLGHVVVRSGPGDGWSRLSPTPIRGSIRAPDAAREGWIEVRGVATSEPFTRHLPRRRVFGWIEPLDLLQTLGCERLGRVQDVADSELVLPDHRIPFFPQWNESDLRMLQRAAWLITDHLAPAGPPGGSVPVVVLSGGESADGGSGGCGWQLVPLHRLDQREVPTWEPDERLARPMRFLWWVPAVCGSMVRRRSPGAVCLRAFGSIERCDLLEVVESRPLPPDAVLPYELPPHDALEDHPRYRWVVGIRERYCHNDRFECWLDLSDDPSLCYVPSPPEDSSWPPGGGQVEVQAGRQTPRWRVGCRMVGAETTRDIPFGLTTVYGGADGECGVHFQPEPGGRWVFQWSGRLADFPVLVAQVRPAGTTADEAGERNEPIRIELPPGRNLYLRLDGGDIRIVLAHDSDGRVSVVADGDVSVESQKGSVTAKRTGGRSLIIGQQYVDFD